MSKKPKKNEKQRQQKKKQKNARRKKVKVEKQSKRSNYIDKLSKMTPEELRAYLGEEEYQSLMAEINEEEGQDASED